MSDQQPTHEEQPTEQAEEQQEVQAATGSPSDFLKQVVGEQVVVRLNSGVDYRGALALAESATGWELAR